MSRVLIGSCYYTEAEVNKKITNLKKSLSELKLTISDKRAADRQTIRFLITDKSRLVESRNMWKERYFTLKKRVELLTKDIDKEEL